MNELNTLLVNMLTENLNQMVLSNSTDKDRAVKAKIRPILLKGKLMFQETLYRGTQVFHHNYLPQDMCRQVTEYLNGLFKQAEMEDKEQKAVILVSKKGKITIKCHKISFEKRTERNSEKIERNIKNQKEEEKNQEELEQQIGKIEAEESKKEQDKQQKCSKEIGVSKNNQEKQNQKLKKEESQQNNEKSKIEKKNSIGLEHNRVKQYILEEGRPVDFLVGLGVQSADGKVLKAKYDKFRQINRYLEFIEDILDELPRDRTIRIIDFGCGKSYLTFAMYYYLHELCKKDIEVIGLDLKTEVIDHCNSLAKEYGYQHLHFEKGDIRNYEKSEQVDMVVSLHACDTATDYALEKAVKWGAKVIMAVPCCQHEVNKQIKCRTFSPILKYGLIKERISALLTDALRANLLEAQGYHTQILEFIEIEHTPKNLLIRAVKQNRMQPKGEGDIREIAEFLHIFPTLEKLLSKNS